MDLLLASPDHPTEAPPVAMYVPFTSDFVHLRNSGSKGTNLHCIQGIQLVGLLEANGLMGTKDDLGVSGGAVLSMQSLVLPWSVSLCASHLACQF